MKVYVDLVALLNFLVDFLLILGTNRLSGYPLTAKRAALAAALGGAYAAVCILPGFLFMANTLWRMVSLVLMSMIAFGWNKSAIQRGAMFVFLSMALGGIANGLGDGSFWHLVLAAAGMYLICMIGFPGKAGNAECVNVIIQHGGKTVQLTALKDTGNTLRDPLTGKAVLVTDAAAGAKLLSLTVDELAHPIETIASGKYVGLRLVPYSAVGQPAGMLLALKVDSLTVNGKKSDQLVAFAPQTIGQGKPYQALAGGMA